MNRIFNNLEYVIIGILILIIVLQRTFQPEPVDMSKYIKIGGKEYEFLMSLRDTIHETKIIRVPGKPIPGKPIPQYIPQNVDTPKVIKDYFSKHPYKDIVNISDDSGQYGTVTVTDTITQNRFVNRRYDFDLKIPTYTETLVVKERPRTQLYVGGGINVDQVNLLNSVYVGTMWKTRKDHLYGLNIGLSTGNDNVTPYIGGSMYWKIKFKKQKIEYDQLTIDAAQLIINQMEN